MRLGTQVSGKEEGSEDRRIQSTYFQQRSQASAMRKEKSCYRMNGAGTLDTRIEKMGENLHLRLTRTQKWTWKGAQTKCRKHKAPFKKANAGAQTSFATSTERCSSASFVVREMQKAERHVVRVLVLLPRYWPCVPKAETPPKNVSNKQDGKQELLFIIFKC